MHEYNSTTSHSRTPSWEQAKSQAWMCRASKQGSLAKEECIHDRPLDDPKYLPKPFLEEKFKPFEWTHILATLFIYSNEVTQT